MLFYCRAPLMLILGLCFSFQTSAGWFDWQEMKDIFASKRSLSAKKDISESKGVVKLAMLTEDTQPYAMIIVEPSDKNQSPVGYVMKPFKAPFVPSSYKWWDKGEWRDKWRKILDCKLCVFTSNYFPDSFATHFAQLVAYHDIDRLEAEGKLQPICSWNVTPPYAQKLRRKLEYDLSTVYAYSEHNDVHSFYCLEKLRQPDAATTWYKLVSLGHVCHKGLFYGYTNHVLYTIGVLENFAGIINLSQPFKEVHGTSSSLIRLIQVAPEAIFEPTGSGGSRK